MSNPYLKEGSSIDDWNLSEDAQRSFVTNVSFNDDNLKKVKNLNTKTKLPLETKDANGTMSLFVNPIIFTESTDQSPDNAPSQIEKAATHCPPFITPETWSDSEKGLMYNGSFSILRSGAFVQTALIPNRPEFLNNFMEWDALNPGDSGTSAKNGPWIWRARQIARYKEDGSDEWKTAYGPYLTTENFNTMSKEDQWARTSVKKKTARVHVNTSPTPDDNRGVSLELRTRNAEIFGETRDTFPLKRIDGSETEDKNDKYYNKSGVLEPNDDGEMGGSLGSFMLLMSLKQDEKREGEKVNKTPPWDVTITMGEAVDIASDDDKAQKITIKMSKGNMAKVSVYGNETEFNMPSPPVATNAQDAGGEDPNMIALSVVPVFNGIQVSVGNYNGLDKKVTGLMSQFCVRNPGLDPTSLYDKTIDIDYDPDDDSSSPFTSIFADPNDEEGPSILVQSTVENDSKNGLVAIGDQLLVDFYNVTGEIAYVPLFYQTNAIGTLYFPVETDVDETDLVRYTVWPVWCKNGMEAFLLKEPVVYSDFTVDDIKATIASYSRAGSTTEPFATASVTLEGVNPFSAGDTVEVTGLDDGNGTWELTQSVGSVIAWEDSSSNDDASQSSVAGGKVKLVGERKGTMLKYQFAIKSGRRTTYKIAEDSDIAEERYKAIIDRFNNSVFSRYPVIIYGALIVRKEKIEISKLHNNNTPYFSLGNNWRNCITNISVTHALEGTTGSMTLDRYALNQIYGNDSDFGIQKVGQVNLAIAMGQSGIDDIGTRKYAFRLGRDNEESEGDLIKGFGYGYGISQDSNSATINVPLYGINKKLEEMKLINSPYFDGRTVKYTMDFLCAWGNVLPDYSAAEINDKMSASSVLGQVQHEFKAGTPLWEAMQTVADDTAHYIVVQPDGKVHIIKIDKFGEPDENYFTPKVWTYPEARVLNLSRNPDFSQFYNKIIVMALQNTAAAASATNPDKNLLDSDFTGDFPIAPLAVGADLTNKTNPHIPWEKILIKPLESFWTEKALQAYAQILAKQALSIYYTGSTSIPGNLGIHLWDKLNDRYWITGITHNFDVQSKSFTTDLTVSILRPTGDLTFDADGIPSVTNPDTQIEPYVP
jgi:hypothetical protein